MSLSAGEITAIMTGVVSLSAWAKLFYDARKNGKNGNGKPCPLHEGLTQEIKTLHEENRSDHKQIFEDIKGLSIAIAGAASTAATAAAAVATVGKGKKMKADPPLISIFFRHTGLKYAINCLYLWLGCADRWIGLSILLGHTKPSQTVGSYLFHDVDGDSLFCNGAGNKC